MASAYALSAMWVPADMNRTFPDNVRFRKDAEPCLQGPLYNVLLAYGHHNHGVGYCQVSPRPPTDPGASPSRGSHAPTARASQPRWLLPGEPRPQGPQGLAQPGLPRPHSPGWASQRGREGAAVDVNTGCVCGTWVTSTLSPRSRWCACVHVRVCACVGECDRRAGTECRASSGSRAPGQSGGALGSGVGSRAPGGPLCAASQGRVSTAQTVSRAGSGADPRAAGPSCRAHWRPWCLGVCGQEDGAGGWGPHAPGP